MKVVCRIKKGCLRRCSSGDLIDFEFKTVEMTADEKKDLLARGRIEIQKAVKSEKETQVESKKKLEERDE